MTDRLKAALAKRRSADLEIERALRVDYKPGTRLVWSIDGRDYLGTVEHNGYGHRLQVRNVKTGRARWIYAYNVVGLA